MQPITVAVVDVDQKKRKQLEQFLRQDKQNIAVLTDLRSNQTSMPNDRRIQSRTNINLIEDTVTRIKRLKPQILLANVSLLSDKYCDLLVALRDNCPETFVVLLIDEAVEEKQILKALANGARGFLDYGVDLLGFSKAVYAVAQGEAWISRKMLGKIMDKILCVSHENSIGST